MTITLIHPSRGRPQKARQTLANWTSKAKGEFYHLLSVDEDDPCMGDYMHVFMLAPYSHSIYGKNRSVVEATNRAAKQATGDILVYLSDDFDCPDGWDELIKKEFENENRPLVIKVDDCLQPHGVAVLTIPIMNRAMYEKLGYFWHPDYMSMFVDEDLYWTAKRLGGLKSSEHLRFPHLHVSNGKAQDDETYRRSAKNWDTGKALFAQRKQQGFPL